ncbi:MAG TPA: o-succinylbenzoate synthase [Ilumatobacteraceae bacterium]|nr:o-succinylbenzoate synthase [Ilumatobacteraceae bacterium]
MRITGATVHLLSLPLVEPFRSARDTVSRRDTSIIELHADVDGHPVTGWGECVALPRPGYTAESRDTAALLIAGVLVPALIGTEVAVDDISERLLFVDGNPMAKSAVEMAVLDAHLRASRQSLASYLGAPGDRVPAGVAIGLQATPQATAVAAHRFVAQGYRRLKLKIAPGNDVEVVAEVRDAVGDAVAIQVDANESYRLDNPDHVRALEQMDQFGLVLIEQPLPRADLHGHAALTDRLATPICLDESIDSFEAAEHALDLGAADVLCIKPGAVGGYLTAVQIHDLAMASGIPLWCGGMLETGFSRAANLALAALPGFTLIGDLSATERYFAADVVAPVTLDRDGMIAVPNVAGAGPAPEHLHRFVTGQLHAG